jgi:hypothetical protein
MKPCSRINSVRDILFISRNLKRRTASMQATDRPFAGDPEESQGQKCREAVLASTCGALELSMSDPLMVQMKAIYDRPEGDSEFAGALLRPMAEGMKEMIKADETGFVEGVFKAAREAGRQLVKEEC